MKELIKSGANINLPGKNRMTALIIASAHGHFHLV
jgi:ankyrin repeat protein